MWDWEALVHVCRRWRHLIFISPQSLDLRLLCTRGTPVQGMLSVWPPIPIIIFDQGGVTPNLPVPNIIAALERHDRVYGIWVHNLTNPQWKIFSAASQKRFPALNFLKLGPNIDTERTLPLEFLGGSAPSLRVVRLNGIPFPAFPHLLLSARDLVHLHLSDIPIEGYVSPIAMVAGLSVLANLQKLSIGFRSSKSPSNWTIRFPRPRRRVILPVLTDFGFRGVSDYLEDFVARIHTPSLHRVVIRFFNQLIFHVPQLAQFVNRTRLRSFIQAEVALRTNVIRLSLLSSGRETYISLEISSCGMDWQLSSLVQVCSHLHPLISTVEGLDLAEKRTLKPNWQDYIEPTQWLELFRTFIAVDTLRLSLDLVPHVSCALQGLTEDHATEVLPALRDLLLEGHEQFSSITQALEPFLFARSRSGDTVAVRPWNG